MKPLQTVMNQNNMYNEKDFAIFCSQKVGGKG